jgi:hypothetical protein
MSGPGFINFSPTGFRIVARDLLRCADQFRPSTFSIVPYFLYSRAIEIGLKALHLETRRQAEVKEDFGHDLLASYEALPDPCRKLSKAELALLVQLNELYGRKAFEYIQPGDAAHAFSMFPDLDDLARLASALAGE